MPLLAACSSLRQVLFRLMCRLDRCPPAVDVLFAFRAPQNLGSRSEAVHQFSAIDAAPSIHNLASISEHSMDVDTQLKTKGAQRQRPKVKLPSAQGNARWTERPKQFREKRKNYVLHLEKAVEACKAGDQSQSCGTIIY